MELTGSNIQYHNWYALSLLWSLILKLNVQKDVTSAMSRNSPCCWLTPSKVKLQNSHHQHHWKLTIKTALLKLLPHLQWLCATLSMWLSPKAFHHLTVLQVFGSWGLGLGMSWAWVWGWIWIWGWIQVYGVGAGYEVGPTYEATLLVHKPTISFGNTREGCLLSPSTWYKHVAERSYDTRMLLTILWWGVSLSGGGAGEGAQPQATIPAHPVLHSQHIHVYTWTNT